MLLLRIRLILIDWGYCILLGEFGVSLFYVLYGVMRCLDLIVTCDFRGISGLWS